MQIFIILKWKFNSHQIEVLVLREKSNKFYYLLAILLKNNKMNKNGKFFVNSIMKVKIK